MWISGRRVVRPDRDYYRSVRRTRLSRTQPRRASAMGAIIGIVVVAAFAVAWLLLKR